jgi:hypothetical protein
MTTLRGIEVRIVAIVLASGAMFGGASLVDPHPALAEQCVGSNGREAQDFSDVQYVTNIDSCKANELVDDYGRVKDASGLAGALGAKWWPVGTVTGAFFAWAWNNQEHIKGAAAAGRGVQFTQVNGIIMEASPQ